MYFWAISESKLGLAVWSTFLLRLRICLLLKKKMYLPIIYSICNIKLSDILAALAYIINIETQNPC